MEDGHRLSEDYSFCKKWIDCGGEIWANVDEFVEHIGMYTYGGIALDRLRHNLIEK
jgi:hypothetical protein